MKSLKHQIVFLLLGSLILLSITITLTLLYNTRERVMAAAIVKAKSDLATCTEIIDLLHPGDWRLENDKLYKGDYLIGQDHSLVDHLSELTGNSVTIFQYDTRISTTFKNEDGSRAIGTKVSPEVAQKVLMNGEVYLGSAEVLGHRYQTAYEPLFDASGKIIGMFYVGISSSYTSEMITNFLIHSGIISLVITIAIVTAALIFLNRFIIKPLQDITLGTMDVATGHSTVKINPIKTPKEIGDLATAFNQLVEKMETLTYHLAKNNSCDITTSSHAISSTTPSPLSNEETPNSCPLLEGSMNKAPTHSEPEAENDDVKPKELPKGLNYATLRQIKQYLKGTQEPVSAEDVAEGVNLTRVTVRRYLEFLEQCGFLKTEMKYGTIGRPVKLFSLNTAENSFKNREA